MSLTLLLRTESSTREKHDIPYEKSLFPLESAVFSISIHMATERYLCGLNKTLLEGNESWQLQRKLQQKK